MKLQIYIRYGAVILLLITTCLCRAESIVHDELIVNGHEGYLSAWETHGPLDKVFILVAGFDTENNDHPADKLYNEYLKLIQLIGPQGWDVIYFDYVDGSIDLKDNADNLARFIDYLDTQAEPDYHLAIVGGSMGGIVARTMFVQEYSAMGVDTYVSVDSPHRGVELSEWVEDLATVLTDFLAGHQMLQDDPAYDEHYGWLETIETDGAFMPMIIDPVNTCAIALSNGENGSWKVYWDDIAIHNKYYPVSSYVSAEGLRSNYVPYHSAVYMDSASTSKSLRWGYSKYQYNNTTSTYFDTKIPNARVKHGAPDYVIQQAVDFVLESFTASN